MSYLVKYFLTAFLLTATFYSYAEGIPELQYQIVSDTTDEMVPEGKCLVYGKITLNNNPFTGVKVSSENHQFYNVADANGDYQFFMDAKEIRVYAFQPGYDEVVTNQYQFRSGHSVRIDFYMKENLQIEISLKPVIYAYCSSEIEANIKMEIIGDLTFTYPKYDNGWLVLINESGISMQNELSKSYPYLFWEGEAIGLTFQSSQTDFNGSQINTDSTIQFLEEKCNDFGFNPTETTDFITFWGPRIQQHKYAKVEFLMDEQYDVIGKLNITPQPDNLKRVYIIFQGSNEFDLSLQCKRVEREPVSRKGFTIIEWGGTELSPSKRMNP